MGDGLMELFERLPTELSKLIAGYEFKENHIGHSQSLVFQLTNRSNHVMYLKIQAVDDGDLLPEKERLEWLQGKLPVPEPIYFDSDNEHQFMLLSEIKGVPSFDRTLRHDIPNLIRELAQGLRTIHSLDKNCCPFSLSLSERIKMVQDRIFSGRVNMESFSLHYPNQTLQELFDEMIRMTPESEELVVCHGDYSMPNIIMLDGRVNGFIDLGQLTVSDRYLDFVTVRNTFRYNKLPDECFTLFTKEYGIQDIDDSKLRFYELLDRFM
jgi:aminoglycoside phosphotransferase